MAQMPPDVKAYNRQLIDEFRAAGRKLEGRQLLLLTTVGRRTSQRRTTPMMFVPDGDNFLVIASNAGAPKHPDWYLNLLAEPRVTVEVNGEMFEAMAVPTSGDERSRLFDAIAGQYPFFKDHQAGIKRLIPIVRLSRRST